MAATREEIARRFKTILVEKGLDRDAAAKRIGKFSIKQIGDMQTGNKIITPEIAELIEDKLGVSAVYIIFGRGSKDLTPAFDLKEEKKANLEKIAQEMEELKGMISKLQKGSH